MTVDADHDRVVVVHEAPPDGEGLGGWCEAEIEVTDLSLRSQAELTVVSIDEKSSQQIAIYDAPSSEIQGSYEISEDEEDIPPELPPKDYSSYEDHSSDTDDNDDKDLEHTPERDMSEHI